MADSFPTNNSDFSTYLNKAKDEGAQVIFCPVSIAYATQIVKQATPPWVWSSPCWAPTL